MTRETVFLETPASRATSLMVVFLRRARTVSVVSVKLAPLSPALANAAD
jgi:hypothetical protein